MEEALTYLDHWEARWADTRIHGATKRQVAVMFAEEKPALLPLPIPRDVPETHVLLDDLAEAVVDGKRKAFMESVATAPLLIIDDFGMRKLPLTAAEDLLEIILRHYERASTLPTSNRPVEDWGNYWATWQR